MREGDVFVTIIWHTDAVPRGQVRGGVAAGGRGGTRLRRLATWALLRSKDDPLDFQQLAAFPDKKAWERYWYSEEISEDRAEAHGLYEVPLLPVWFQAVGAGELVEDESVAAP